MKKLRIDIDELIWTFENTNRLCDLFLNTKTGDLISEEDFEVEDAGDDDIEELENESLLPVPEADLGEGFSDIEDFIYTVAEGPCRRELEQALGGRKPFRRFKDVLYAYPPEQERWYKFKESRMKARVIEWLHENDIEVIEDT